MYPQRKWNKKRTAVVTGGSRRVGKVIARKLVEEGWDVVIQCRDEKLGLEVKRELGLRGVVVGDLCHRDTYVAMSKAVENILDGELGLLVNNASTFVTDDPDPSIRWSGFSQSVWQAHWAYCMTTQLVPQLNRSGGLAVSLTDWATVEMWPGFVAHGMAKTAIEAMGGHLSNSKKAREGRGFAAVALRLPTVLPPDHMGDDEVINLEERHGRIHDVSGVPKAILTLTEASRFGYVAEMIEGGEIRWAAQ